MTLRNTEESKSAEYFRKLERHFTLLECIIASVKILRQNKSREFLEVKHAYMQYF